ncbi:MAG: methyltransferase domain-containing protein [Actinobacteria bacterium]|nr:methyltransferase domain-containing protein [Actinomycetota bacterium]
MVPLACPVCHADLSVVSDVARCSSCAHDYPVVDGTGRFLPPDRAAAFAAFLHDYTTVRLAEGRASGDPDVFRRLPEPTAGSPLEAQWRMRARTWAVVQRRVLGVSSGPLRVLDVGAGVGWLSNRLTELGHVAAAIDLTVDPDDGLGACRHYSREFVRLQAEMDALPVADASVDLVIFNASLHYSTDLERTLGEALRVLAPGGRVVVMDSPIYRRAADGESMIAERHADFERRFGTRSDSVPSIGFLTPEMLATVAAALGLTWSRHRPWYGWRWAWKPWRARLRRRRAPSRFELLVARRAA